MPMGYNRVLGDERLPEALRPHRVAIAGWPTSPTERRTASLDALIAHVAGAGYEGFEFAVGSFTRFFPGDSPRVVASKARAAVEKAGLRVFGSTLHVGDEAMRALNWIDGYVEQMKLVQELGGQYASFQITLHADYLNTGGAYREDERYLQWCADRVAELREAAWGLGLNFYNEVHIHRITEDPAALCRILELCDHELNGDMSHYLYRGITAGRHVEKINRRVNHSHVRMCRVHGDLSAMVEDPKADWAGKGVTWQMFQAMKPILTHGLSSRTLAGESGPMHLVKDTLTLDASLVPLYRAMARFADAAAQGMVMKVEDPGDLRPWG